MLIRSASCPSLTGFIEHPAGGNYHQSYYATSSHTTLHEEATSILTQGDTLPHENRLFNVVHGDGKPFTEQETEYLVKYFDNHCLPIFWKPGWIAILDNER